jgi:hypothetical protein
VRRSFSFGNKSTTQPIKRTATAAAYRHPRWPSKTMLKRVAIFLLVFNVACATPHRRLSGVIPWPGQEAPRSANIVSVVHGGRDLCSRSVTVNDVEYNFDTACGGNVVLYAQTLDKKFVSPEGLSIGRALREAVGAGGTLREDNDCGVTLPSGWIARPQMGRTTQGSTVTPCSEVLEDEISYFDTELIEPNATANPVPAADG